MPETFNAVVDIVVSRENIWWQLVVAVVIIFAALLIRGIFTRSVFKIILRLTSKTKTDLDSAILLAFEGPLKALIVAVGFYAALNYLPLPESVTAFVAGLFRSAIIVFVAWGLYNVVGGRVSEEISMKLEVDEILAGFATKIARFLVVALSISIIAQEWNYDVSGFLAGLGLGGLAFALAAKDAVANLFGGMIIILDKPFDVGDWILTPSVEGTVEEMSFRSTKVRTFANSLVTVPNSIIANEAITNWTRMRKRRVFFRLGVTYTTPRGKMQNCVNKIRDLLENHPEVDKDLILVRFEQFNDSSLDIFIYYFTITRVWGEYLEIKEEINYKIMEILEGERVSVAFPSRSVYFENPLEGSGGVKEAGCGRLERDEGRLERDEGRLEGDRGRLDRDEGKMEKDRGRSDRDEGGWN